jgi:hypothetical protein
LRSKGKRRKVFKIADKRKKLRNRMKKMSKLLRKEGARRGYKGRRMP